MPGLTGKAFGEREKLLEPSAWDCAGQSRAAGPGRAQARTVERDCSRAMRSARWTRWRLGSSRATCRRMLRCGGSWRTSRSMRCSSLPARAARPCCVT